MLSSQRNNLDNQQRLRSPKRSGTTPLGDNDVKSNQDDIKYSNRMDIYSDSNENAIKINDEPTSEDDRPPRLPPRPPPRPRNQMNNEAGMIYSCRFCVSHAKWCPINWVNWKSFSPFFSLPRLLARFFTLSPSVWLFFLSFSRIESKRTKIWIEKRRRKKCELEKFFLLFFCVYLARNDTIQDRRVLSV